MDRVPCLIGPDPESDQVWVIDPDDVFDATMALLGFASWADAKAAYLAVQPDGARHIGSAAEMDIEEFSYRLRHGDASKPFARRVPPMRRA